MALLQPTDIQIALNIDLTGPDGRALATFRMGSAVTHDERVPGCSLVRQPQAAYFGVDVQAGEAGSEPMVVRMGNGFRAPPVGWWNDMTHRSRVMV